MWKFTAHLIPLTYLPEGLAPRVRRLPTLKSRVRGWGEVFEKTLLKKQKTLGFYFTEGFLGITWVLVAVSAWTM
jgi:hypothetical protein